MSKKLLTGSFLIIIISMLIAGCSIFGDLEELHEKALEEKQSGAIQTSTVVVTVSPDPVMVTRGGSQPFAATVHGDGDPSQEVTWSVTGGVSGTSINATGLLTVSDSETPGTILTVTATSVAYSSSSGSATAEVAAVVHAQTPSFTVHPLTATYSAGASAAALTGLASASDGGTVTYQWYSNGTPSNSGGVNLGVGSGAQTQSFTPSTSTVGTMYYYVVATNTITNNGDGGDKIAAAASNTAAITVNAQVNAQLPNIIVHPSSTVYAQGATSTALTVVAVEPTDGGSLTYQWYSNGTPSNSGGTDLGAGNGAQTAGYTPPTTAIGTVYYYAVVTNTITNNGDGGNKTATAASNPAAITVNAKVNALPPNISGHPTGGVAYTQNASAAALTVSVSSPDGGTLTFQWYSNGTNSNSGGSPLGVANGAQTQSFTPSTATAGTLYYYVVVTNTIADNSDGGIKTATAASNTAAITVNEKVNAQAPVISTHPLGASYTHNAPASSLTVGASSPDSGTLSFQWYSNAENNTSGGNTVGTNSNSYTPSTATVGTLYYYVVVTNTIGNNGDGGNKAVTATSSVAAITVNAIVNAQTPVIGIQPAASTTYTYKAATVSPLTVGASISDGGNLSFQWYWNSSNNTLGTSLPGETNASYTPSVTSIGTRYYYVIVTNTNPGVNGSPTAVITSNVVSVTVNQKTLTLNTVTHTKEYDNTNTVTSIPAPLTVTFTGVETGDTVTASAISAVYTGVNAGTTTVNISAMTLSNTNYTIALPINSRSVTGGITKKNISFNVSTQPRHTLIGFGTTDSLYRNETTFDVLSSGILVGDSVTVNLASNTLGLSLSGNTSVTNSTSVVPLKYNGTTAVTQTAAQSVGLTIATHVNYILSGSTNNISVKIIDGQAYYNGTGVDRRIPVTKTNIGQFNTYANTANGLKRHYKLTANIAASELPYVDANNNWVAIGSGSPSYPGDLFTGSFNGDGFYIDGLKINVSNSAQGLFGGIGPGSIVEKVGLRDCNITAIGTAGGIAGLNYMGRVSKCYVRKTSPTSTAGINDTYGYGGLGGIVGSNVYGTVEYCYSRIPVSSEGSSVGGVVGSNDGTYGDMAVVQYCYATENVKGALVVGGVVGGSTANTKVNSCVALMGEVQYTSNNPGVPDTARVVNGAASATKSNLFAYRDMYITTKSGSSNSNMFNYVTDRATKDGQNVLPGQNSDAYGVMGYNDDRFWKSSSFGLEWNFTAGTGQWEMSAYSSASGLTGMLPILQGMQGQ